VRRLVVLLLVLVGLLLVADRIAVTVAQSHVADRIRVDQHLDRTPDVSIGGFPFLTQPVTVTVHDVTAGALRVQRLTAHLHGVHVPFSAVAHGSVSRVPVDRASAELVVTYADLDAALSGQGVQVSYAGAGRVHVATSAGSGDARVSIEPQAIRLTGDGVELRIPLPGLPFRTRLTSATAGPDGVAIRGSAQGLVLTG
jgi:hypothetical protein